MLAIIGLILIAIWIFGLVFHIAGAFIHLILLCAVFAFVFHLVFGRRST